MKGICSSVLCCENKVHFLALLPLLSMCMNVFLSYGCNYDVYLAKGSLQVVTDRMQELCTTTLFTGALCFGPLIFITFVVGDCRLLRCYLVTVLGMGGDCGFPM